MGIRDNSLLRYFAAIVVLIASSALILIYLQSAINGTNPGGYGYSYYLINVPIYVILAPLYVLMFIEGLLALFPSRHLGLGITLIIGAILVVIISAQLSASLGSAPSNSLSFALVYSLVLAIAGIALLIYKPQSDKPASYPKAAKRSISLGAFLLLLAFLLYLGAEILAILSLQGEINSYNAAQLIPISRYAPLVIVYLIIALAVFIATLYSGYKLNTDSADLIRKHSKRAILMAGISIVSITALIFAFQIYGIFSISNSSATAAILFLLSPSGIYGSTLSVSSLIPALSLAYSASMWLGFLLLIAGGLSGLAFSEKLGFAEYLSSNRKQLLYAAATILVLYASFSLYSGYRTSSGNRLALSALNNKIQADGINLRYLLANKNEYDAALAGTNATPSNYTYSHAEGMYQTLTLMANPQGNLSSVFTFSNPALHPYWQQQQAPAYTFFGLGQSQATYNLSNQKINQFDWYHFNPQIRLAELVAFYNLGLLDLGANAQNYSVIIKNQALFIPARVSPLQSMYELQAYGAGILLDSQALGILFSMQQFTSPPINTHSIPSNDLGVGLAALPSAAMVSLTTISNGSFYDLVSGSTLSTGWLELTYASNPGYGFVNINNTAFDNKFFYVLSLSQYASYYASQMFYNKSIAPNLDFIGYMNNTVVVNLGDINLTNPQISLYIDGNKTQYSRYYNYLVIYGKHLGIGLHTIRVDVNNSQSTQNFYVSPVGLSEPLLSHAGTLSFSIPNLYPTSLNVSNISVSGGVIPPPSITPQILSNLIYNWSASYAGSVTLSNVSYVTFDFYQKRYDNYTKTNYTVRNVTRRTIPISPGYTIGRNDSLYLNYTVPPHPLGYTGYYTVTFNTNYGKEYSIISAKAS